MKSGSTGSMTDTTFKWFRTAEPTYEWSFILSASTDFVAPANSHRVGASCLSTELGDKSRLSGMVCRSFATATFIYTVPPNREPRCFLHTLLDSPKPPAHC